MLLVSDGRGYTQDRPGVLTEPLTTQAQVLAFLRGGDIDVRVAEGVLRQVVKAILAGEKMYPLYSGSDDRQAVCSRGTINRIRRLLNNGLLDPYVVRSRAACPRPCPSEARLAPNYSGVDG